MSSYLTTQDVADRLRIAPQTLMVWRSRGKGPAWRKLGARVVYEEAEVLAWVDSHRRNSTRDVSHSAAQATTAA